MLGESLVDPCASFMPQKSITLDDFSEQPEQEQAEEEKQSREWQIFRDEHVHEYQQQAQRQEQQQRLLLQSGLHGSLGEAPSSERGAGVTSVLISAHSSSLVNGPSANGKFECKFCGLKYTAKGKMKQHTLRKHPEVRGALFDSLFPKKSTSIGKQFVCGQSGCGRGFDTKGALTRHYRQKHS